MTDVATIRSHYTPSSYFKHCTVLYCTVLYCNDLRVLGHITQPAHTATTLSVAICNLLLYLQVRWGPIMCCQESSCQYVGDKSKISIRASLARPAALQHCSTAEQPWGSYTQSPHSATPPVSIEHSVTSNKPHSALSMGFWSPEKFVPAIVHIFRIAVGTRPHQSWDIYFWAQSECQLSWGRARTSSRLTGSCWYQDLDWISVPAGLW